MSDLTVRKSGNAGARWWGASATCAAALCLSVGFAVSASAAPTKVEKAFGAWTVSCVEDNNVKRCSMSQSRSSGQQKKRVVFMWSVGQNASKELVNSIVVPAGVSVKEGIRVSVGNNPPKTVPYEICGPRVCAANFPLDAGMLQAMNSSPQATSNYVHASRKLVQVQLDLKDFPKAYEYFKSQVP